MTGLRRHFFPGNNVRNIKVWMHQLKGRAVAALQQTSRASPLWNIQPQGPAPCGFHDNFIFTLSENIFHNSFSLLSLATVSVCPLFCFFLSLSLSFIFDVFCLLNPLPVVMCLPWYFSVTHVQCTSIWLVNLITRWTKGNAKGMFFFCFFLHPLLMNPS